ncbi:ASC protein, partial [Penelope pileata]|nr:ASC protein [Penelope pileata]
MRNAVAELLWAILEQLEEDALLKFKRELSKIQPKEGYERIELQSVEELSPAALASLLYSHYGRPHCVEVTADVLGAMGRMDLADALLDRLNHGAWFIEQHREFLIQRACNVSEIIKELLQEGVLSPEQRDSIMEETMNQKRMQ